MTPLEEGEFNASGAGGALDSLEARPPLGQSSSSLCTLRCPCGGPRLLCLRFHVRLVTGDRRGSFRWAAEEEEFPDHWSYGTCNLGAISTVTGFLHRETGRAQRIPIQSPSSDCNITGSFYAVLFLHGYR